MATSAKTKAFLASRRPAHRTETGCRAEAAAPARDPMGRVLGFEAAAGPDLVIHLPLFEQFFSAQPGIMGYVSMPFAADGFHLRTPLSAQLPGG